MSITLYSKINLRRTLKFTKRNITDYMFYFLGKDPVPIRCPVAGAFNFTQEGDFPFKTRILGGITKDPRHDVWGRTGQFSCKQNISRLAVCDTGKYFSCLDSYQNFVS